MLFDLQRRQRDGWVVLAVVGELDLSAVPAVRQAALSAVPPAGRAGAVPPRVVVDLSEAPFVDSAGLGVVLGIVRRVRQAGGEAVVVLDAGSPVGRVFTVLGLDRVIPVAGAVDDVIARGRHGRVEPVGAGPAGSPPAPAPTPALTGETGGGDG